MSGGEPSSIKQSNRCAVRVPVLSSRLENRVEADFDLEVYGLVLRLGAVLFFAEPILSRLAERPSVRRRSVILFQRKRCD